MSLLAPIQAGNTEGVKWAKLQRWMRQAVDNAGISYTMSYPLTDIDPSDTEGVKWAKLGAWTQLLAANIVPAGGGGGGLITSAVLTGAAAVNDIVGYYAAPAATTISRVQIAAQTPPVGAALKVTLVDGSGVSLGEIATLDDGASFQETVLGTPLVLAPGEVVRFKITQIGSGTSGGYLTINLL